MRDHIEINKELIPYRFNILLAGQWFELYVSYNQAAEMFTVGLYKDDTLITTEPLVLGVPLFHDVYQPNLFPAIEIVPYDSSGLAEKVTFDNLGESVFLTIDDEGVDMND